ncbi:MAG: copper-binding protein [Desulfovibrio sp.]|jgi:Cu(I)/Ag(I) efflux system membrane fusion protein|nr:copper-binding protein [Desulfovibrio sp.]
MNRQLISILALLFVIVSFPGNTTAAGHDHSGHGTSRPAGQGSDTTGRAESGKVYTIRGVIETVERESGRVTIHHPAIPELKWPAMSMRFAVESPDLLEGLAEGQSVRFDFRAAGEDYVIMDIEKIR